ncbi:hypothetical protein KKC1_11580 [Calderihabitans maritimus]|uniref:Uncharacterized protein n=1 Tax=Calderihabitans maritimus TaxID=1246530 RepID=A0A1Z5HRC8_9FIRM|nr:hypothetical protein KKC1_11580 [Calderihabitans maritimus]
MGEKMKKGDRVIIKESGCKIMFYIIEFTRNKAGERIAILKDGESNSNNYRFVPLYKLEVISDKK